MAPVAVINEVHSVAIKIQAWMLSDLGYEVYAAGASYRPHVPLYHYSGRPIQEVKGLIELAGTPQDALFLDTHPESEGRLRAAGFHGPILIVWQMPVGPDWVRDHFHPGKQVGSLAWSAAVGRVLGEMKRCPHDYFWPPYYGALDRTPREGFDPFLMTVVENAAGWSNVPVLEALRDDPETKLELYGGAPPPWSQKIPQAQLFARMRRSLAMYHLKPFDTPGLAVMEAAFQAVPIIFPPDWIRCTETEFFKDGENCLIVPTDKKAVIEAARRLKDPAENRRIGMAGREAILAATDWQKNRLRLENLIRAIRES
jgi:hypothetical protein